MPLDEAYIEPTADEQIERALSDFKQATNAYNTFDQILALELIDIFSSLSHGSPFAGPVKDSGRETLIPVIEDQNTDPEIKAAALKVLRNHFAETVVVTGITTQLQLESWAQQLWLTLKVDAEHDLARLPAHIAGNLSTSATSFAPPLLRQ